MNYNVSVDMEGNEELRSYLREKVTECKDSTYFQARNKDAAQPINMFVTDEKQKWLGGITSELYWNWLEINDCWVYEEFRGQGIEKELVQKVERMARKRGADYSMLTTFEQETMAFYKKNGYEIVGKIEDYVPGTNFYTLKKSL
ncbi:N-acetyltransferase [Halobacillus sp. Marseille-Q1614]|uniref:GNAT family N-acetyltransferase n=1 Tax=Halobacillus sp. Marseille-Q1614 TaxID=2709134 RepID=UPI001571311C|nr:GNAT family N-acetyltransferase [Halobacillus sp. Marseille-Q1614]